MRKAILGILVVLLLLSPVHAVDYELPPVTGKAAEYLPSGEGGILSDFLELCGKAVNDALPSCRAALSRCAGVLAVSLICSVLPGSDGISGIAVKGIGSLTIAVMLVGPADILISEAVSSVYEIVDYARVLLPAMTGALAAAGGTGRAAAIYMGATFINGILSEAMGAFLVPLVYMQLSLAITSGLTEAPLLRQLQEFLQKLVVWGLKLLLGIFSAYMAVSGAITGSADAAALKAAKLTISGAVPVVGGMLSDAAETLLLSSAAMRSAVGLGGLLAILAISIGPFIGSGVQYLLVRLTGVFCTITGNTGHCTMIDGIGQAFGVLLGIMGTCALMQLISIACFLKGVSA